MSCRTCCWVNCASKAGSTVWHILLGLEVERKGGLYRIKLELVEWNMVDFMNWSLMLFPCLCCAHSHYQPMLQPIWLLWYSLLHCSSPWVHMYDLLPPMLFLSVSAWQIPTCPKDSDSQKTEYLSFLQHPQAELNISIFMMPLYLLHFYSITLSTLPYDLFTHFPL